MKELMIALMVWASPLVGLPVPADLPAVKQTSHCDIQRIVGIEECKAQGPQAIYLHEVDTIVLPDHWSPTEPYHVAMLLHELVHFMQDRAGHDAGNVECVASELEAPAYRAQMAWLKASGRDEWETSTLDPLGLAIFTHCFDLPFYQRR